MFSWLQSETRNAGEICALCKQPSKHQCGGCETVAYCSGKHQKEHWNQHKDKCKAYKVVTNDKVGRYSHLKKWSKIVETLRNNWTDVIITIGLPFTYASILTYIASFGRIMYTYTEWSNVFFSRGRNTFHIGPKGLEDPSGTTFEY